MAASVAVLGPSTLAVAVPATVPTPRAPPKPKLGLPPADEADAAAPPGPPVPAELAG